MKIFDEPLLEDEYSSPASLEDDSLSLQEKIERLMEGQDFAVLSTQGHSQPYSSLIAYTFTDDLKWLFFATPITTRKYKLLMENQKVSLLIDNRCKYPEEILKVAAITITGRATEVSEGEAYEEAKRYLKRHHAYLGDFLEAQSTAIFQVEVVRYFYVTRFQEVSQWIP